MDLRIGYLFQPHLKKLHRQECIEYVYSHRDKLILSHKDFSKMYPEFDIDIYKRMNTSTKDLNILDTLIHYHHIGHAQLWISNISDFYKKYNDFNLENYMSYVQLTEVDDVQVMVHYHLSSDAEKEKYALFEHFQKKVCLTFVHAFYKEDIHHSMSIEDIIIQLKRIHNFFYYSLKHFLSTHKEFNLNMYKRCNPDLLFSNDIEYAKYWFLHRKNDARIDSVASFLNKYPHIDIHYFPYYQWTFVSIEESIIEYELSINISVLCYHDLRTLLVKHEDFIMKFVNNLSIDGCIEILQRNKKYEKEDLGLSSLLYMDNPITAFSNEFVLYQLVYFVFEREKWNAYVQQLKEEMIHFDVRLCSPLRGRRLYTLHVISQYPTFHKGLFFHFQKELCEMYQYESLLFHIEDLIEMYPNLIYDLQTYLRTHSFHANMYTYFQTVPYYASEEELILHFETHDKKGIIYNLSSFYEQYPDFDMDIYMKFNVDVEKDISEEERLIVFHKQHHASRIYSIPTFQQFYTFEEESKERIMEFEFGNQSKVEYIHEVLFDLELPTQLRPGLSLIIRAKNEEANVKPCIESVIDLVDEIIFVDNGSTDNTYALAKEYESEYPGILKVYQYCIPVSKAGTQHQWAVEHKHKNTLAYFYNWCLHKATCYNVAKWDADFLCIRQNFKEMVELYALRTRDDLFALWFSGKTLFENHEYYINIDSYYNEYRAFSYRNGFQWYDGDLCEYTEPYLRGVVHKYEYLYPIFYELKRTSMDEFAERSSFLDHRDRTDHSLLQDLTSKKNIKNTSLVHIPYQHITHSQCVLIITPSLNWGGGNQFVCSMYSFFKNLGWKVQIMPIHSMNRLKNDKFSNILDEDIAWNYSIEYVHTYHPSFLFFNSVIPYTENELASLVDTKRILITHSDVAYSNFYIEKFTLYLDIIVTVNLYTIQKIKKRYSNRVCFIPNYIRTHTFQKKSPSLHFGMFSRFSIDKNVPMLLESLIAVFEKYPQYNFNLIGTSDSKEYDEYLKKLCKKHNLTKQVYFRGYQSDTKSWYEKMQFIILPSVSEGASYNILEAMSYGIPVIASDVGGNHELIEHAINGISIFYTHLREYEQDVFYITDYEKHLELIGYIRHTEANRQEYIKELSNPFGLYPPHVLKPACYNCMRCNVCQVWNEKSRLWNKNRNSITTAIFQMIESDQQIWIQRSQEKVQERYSEKSYYEHMLSVIQE